MRITVDSESGLPAYRQIVDQIRVLIVERKLEAGAGLPPVRALARELKVHHNTVAEAYRTLAADGLLEIAHGRGATVAGRKAKDRGKDSNKGEASVNAMRQRMREMIAEYRVQGLTRKQIARELRGLTEALDA